jgi:hypothetical protein
VRPMIVQSDDGLFVAVRCPVHGETFHRVTVTDDKRRSHDGARATIAFGLR